MTLKALAKDAVDRFQDADAVRAELTRALTLAEDRASGAGGRRAAARCPHVRRAQPGGAEVLRRVRRADDGDEPDRRCRRAASGGPSSAAARAQSPSRRPGGERRPVGRLPLIGREDDLAWLEARRARGALADRRAHRRRRGRRQDAPGPRVPRVRRGGGRRRRADGPRPRLGRGRLLGAPARDRPSRRAARPTGGGPRDWVAATPGGPPRARRRVRSGDAPERSTALSPEERRFAAAEALRWAVVRASERARGHRVVLAVDDLGSVDGASRNAFADALSDPPLVPALLIGTSSPSFDPGGPPTSPRRACSLRCRRARSLKALARSSRPSSPALTGSRAIVPLYVEQLLRFLREESGAVPKTLADIIAVRLERLPADARRVLQAAAVWGDDADDELLMRMLERGRRPGRGPRVPPSGRHDRDRRRRDPHVAPAAARGGAGDDPGRGQARAAHRGGGRSATSAICPIEVRALHELAGGTSFQALLLLERVSVAGQRARRPSGRGHGAPPRASSSRGASSSAASSTTRCARS